VVICLERGEDCLHMVQLMPLHPKTPSSLALFKSRLVLTFLDVPRHFLSALVSEWIFEDKWHIILASTESL